MPIELKMPALSPTMEEGTLAKWLVKEGDVVKSGDILAEIETDKATMEFEAVDEGTIGKIVVAEGTDNVKVGTVIATITGEGEEAGDAAAAAPAATKEDSPEPQAAADEKKGDTVEDSAHPAQEHASCSPPPITTPKLPIPKFPPVPRWSSRPSARRCATPWLRKCALTPACS
jgi:pyruvate dehydrogenase E1 component beta subunit